MISSFHAAFGLRQRDKSAKEIDYKNEVIRVLEIPIFTHVYCWFAWRHPNNRFGLTPENGISPKFIHALKNV